MATTDDLDLVVVAATDPDVATLVDELSALLHERFGGDGRSGFVPEQEGDAVVILARSGDRLLGCGAMRMLAGHDGVAEIKRMYARPTTSGVGGAILRRLEDAARAAGCSEARLETRRANERAVGFYEHAGYRECAPYGAYVGRADAICLAKMLA